MSDSITTISGEEATSVIGREVLFINNLQELQRLSEVLTVKMEYNVILHCNKGHILLDLGGEHHVEVLAGELLLVPAYKLLLPMMVSTDVEARAILFSDRVLKTTLGPQQEIWNRAMYMQQIHTIRSFPWIDALQSFASSLIRDTELELQEEIIFSFMRTFLLFICESLLKGQENMEHPTGSSGREKMLFGQFLDAIAHESQKYRRVAYYANKLCITPKYLSAICRNVSGKKPLRWITESVVEECGLLLRTTDLSMKEVAHRIGFPNPSFFGQYFRSEIGMTPGEYRQNCLKGTLSTDNHK